MLCKYCNKEIKDDSTFCKYCGKSVQKDDEKLFCTSCGNKIDTNSLFCAFCGAPSSAKAEAVNNTISPAIAEAPSNKKTGKASKKKILIWIAVILGLMIVLASFGDEETPANETATSTDTTDTTDTDDVIDPTSAPTQKPSGPVKAGNITYEIEGTSLVIRGEGAVDKKAVKSFAKNSYDTVDFRLGDISIPDDTFSGFTNIKKVMLNDSVSRIGARAFKGCTFDFIAIDKKVSQIGTDAFADCLISEVYLNNPQIRANLNTRYDFGKLFENAKRIAIHYSNGSQSADEGFTLDASGWGEYLRNNKQYSNLKSIAASAASLAKQNYELWANASDASRIAIDDDGSVIEPRYPKDVAVYYFDY